MGRGLLPLFPLGTVLFPGLVLPLHVFEDRYRALVRDLLGRPADQARQFGVVAIQRGWEVDTPTGPGRAPDIGPTRASLTLHEIGCTAEMRQVTEHPDGRFDLVTVGRRRFRIEQVNPEAAPYLTADVEFLEESPGAAGVADRLAPRVLASFRRYLALVGPGSPATDEQLPEEPTVLSHLVAATALLTLDERQQLLAISDTGTRLRAELGMLRREVGLLGRVRAVPVPLSALAVPLSQN